MLGGILVFGNGAPELLEELVEIGRRASVNLLPGCEDDQAIEQSHDAVARLMN